MGQNRHSTRKTLTLDYSGGTLGQPEGITVLEDLNGHAKLGIDTTQVSVSQAIAQISGRVELRDLSVTGETIDETVVSLYKEFAI